MCFPKTSTMLIYFGNRNCFLFHCTIPAKFICWHKEVTYNSLQLIKLSIIYCRVRLHCRFDLEINKKLWILLFVPQLRIVFAILSWSRGRLAIFVGELARDNVAGHTESVKSYHLGRLVSRVVNHGEKSRRLFDAFYNALKVTINYRRRTYGWMRSAKTYIYVYMDMIVCVRTRVYVDVCLCRVHINLEHTAVAMPATFAE